MKSLFAPFLFGSLCLGCLTGAANAFDVRTAAQDSQPKFVMNGSVVEGLCVDIFHAMERLDPELKFSQMHEFLPMARIERGLFEGTLDVFCGMAKTPTRQSQFDFVDIPLYLTHSVLAARKGDNVDVKSFEDLGRLGADGMVLVVSKTVHAEVLAAQPGVRYVDTASSTSDNIRLLLLGRGRFIFHSDFALADELRRDNSGDKIRILPAQFLTEGRYLVIGRGVPAQLKEKLRTAVERLQKSGQLQSLFKTYEPR